MKKEEIVIQFSKRLFKEHDRKNSVKISNINTTKTIKFIPELPFKGSVFCGGINVIPQSKHFFLWISPSITLGPIRLCG